MLHRQNLGHGSECCEEAEGEQSEGDSPETDEREAVVGNRKKRVQNPAKHQKVENSKKTNKKF